MCCAMDKIIVKQSTHGWIIPKPETYPKTNLIRKWSSLCLGIQFVNDALTVFYNGQHVNEELEMKRKEDGKNMDSQLPEGYFKGILLLVQNMCD